MWLWVLSSNWVGISGISCDDHNWHWFWWDLVLTNYIFKILSTVPWWGKKEKVAPELNLYQIIQVYIMYINDCTQHVLVVVKQYSNFILFGSYIFVFILVCQHLYVHVVTTYSLIRHADALEYLCKTRWRNLLLEFVNSFIPVSVCIDRGLNALLWLALPLSLCV